MDDLRALSEEKVNLLCQNAPTKPFSTGWKVFDTHGRGSRSWGKWTKIGDDPQVNHLPSSRLAPAKPIVVAQHPTFLKLVAAHLNGGKIGAFGDISGHDLLPYRITAN